MKLRTDLSNEQPFGRHIDWKTTGDLYHDALVAHALVIALQEQMMVGHRLSVAPIELRATNLLREWGYAE